MARQWQTWDRAVTAYLSRLAPLRATGTVKAVRNKLLHFTCRVHVPPPAFTPQHYRAWMDGLQRSDIAASSVSRLHSEARRLLRWMGHPSATDIPLMRVPAGHRPIRTCSEAELTVLLKWGQRRHPAWRDRRLAVHVMILATSVMRAGECLALKWLDWHPSSHRFHLRTTRTGRERWALVHPPATTVLEAWRGESPEWARMIVWSRDSPGGPMSSARMRGELARLGRVLGFPVNAKTFRATIVHRVVDASGYDEAAAVVGHTNTATTAAYHRHITVDRRAERAHASALSGVLGYE